MNSNYFYKNLKFIRTSRGLSKNQFAKLLEYNVSTISRWENENNGATLESTIDISEKLKIPIYELVGVDLSQKDKKIKENLNEKN